MSWQLYIPTGLLSEYDKSVGRGHAVWPVSDLASSIAFAGRVPDDALYSGTPLTLSKASAGQITLSWAPSCTTGDTDFEIYRGTIPDFTLHEPLYYNTGGATTQTFVPVDQDSYYLVVPTEGSVEGSYGLRSGAVERPQSPSACLPQSIGACP